MRPDGSVLPYAEAQLEWIVVAAVAFVIARAVPYDRVLAKADLIYVAVLVSLALVLVVAPEINGSRRWFHLGPLKAQPSQLAGLALVLVLAELIGQAAQPGADGAGPSLRRLRGLVGPALAAALPFALILAEPDLGTALVLVPVTLSMLFVAGRAPAALRPRRPWPCW